ncbi:DEAD/DEAH box helicase family protein [Candidatus Peregrinibacteria bacterium]|nr:MAG: DEAD/DEAH box helicase family protein [Candidatus Peregrinibacteria bacterium]
MYASIILFKKLGAFDDALTYLIPNDLTPVLKVGSGVVVPFGQRSAHGVVVAILDQLPSDLEVAKIKPIASLVADFQLPAVSVEVARQMAQHYHCSLAKAIRLWVPKQVWDGALQSPSIQRLCIADRSIPIRGSNQMAVFEWIQSRGACTDRELKAAIPHANLALKTLLQKGVLRSDTEHAFPPFQSDTFHWPVFEKTLTEDQQAALTAIQNADRPVLLHGVTGSGKTEVYLRLIGQTIAAGRQAILLVPEIALTPQTVAYFKALFGEHVAVFHSQLNASERANEWWKVRLGYAPLTIGSRSAVFAPMTDWDW